jgi:hypothetical protein
MFANPIKSISLPNQIRIRSISIRDQNSLPFVLLTASFNHDLPTYPQTNPIKTSGFDHEKISSHPINTLTPSPATTFNKICNNGPDQNSWPTKRQYADAPQSRTTKRRSFFFVPFVTFVFNYDTYPK